MRRLRRLRGYLSLRHHAHRSRLPPVLQHRAQLLLGVLLVRESMLAERDRRSRLCGLRPAGAQGQGAQGTGEGIDLLEDQVSGRALEGVRIPDQDHTLGFDQGTVRVRGARLERPYVATARTRAYGTPHRRAARAQGGLAWAEAPSSWIRTS